jgi:hypothetical protein
MSGTLAFPPSSLPTRAHAARLPGVTGVGAALRIAWPTVVGTSAFVLHAAALGDWLVDDAGISAAYARSLAAGHGLVAQSGAAPVEGFSNPLWTLLLAAASGLGVLDSVLAAKVMAAALVAIALACLVAAARRDGEQGPGLVVVPLLVASSTPFTVWAASGLENALLAALAALSFLLAASALRGAEPQPRLDLASGGVASLLALTRPDGILYAAAYPAVLLFTTRRDLGARRVLVGRVLRYALAFAAPLGAYLILRRVWFGDWLPNNYHAKGGPEVSSLLDPTKLRGLLEGAAGSATLPLAAAVLALGLVLGVSRRLGRILPVAGIYLAPGVAAYLLLPEDWMGEHRFATAVFVFLPWLGWALLRRALAWLPFVRARRAVLGGLGALAVAASAATNAERTAAFAADPTVPLARVAAFADGYARLSDQVDVARPTLLTADVGGMLLRDRLGIHDLAGLCDKTIARTLGSDATRFHDYVFDEVRPTFIHVHGHWAAAAALDRDPRLGLDYVPLWEAFEAPGGRIVGEGAPGQAPWSADYVRRDAVGHDSARLIALRRTFVAERLPWLGRDGAWRVTSGTLRRGARFAPPGSP